MTWTVRLGGSLRTAGRELLAIVLGSPRKCGEPLRARRARGRLRASVSQSAGASSQPSRLGSLIAGTFSSLRGVLCRRSGTMVGPTIGPRSCERLPDNCEALSGDREKVGSDCEGVSSDHEETHDD